MKPLIKIVSISLLNAPAVYMKSKARKKAISLEYANFSPKQVRGAGLWLLMAGSLKTRLEGGGGGGNRCCQLLICCHSSTSLSDENPRDFSSALVLNFLSAILYPMPIGADLDGVSELASRNRTVDISFSSEMRKTRHGRLGSMSVW
jgi:hypothetical protein